MEPERALCQAILKKRCYQRHAGSGGNAAVQAQEGRAHAQFAFVEAGGSGVVTEVGLVAIVAPCGSLRCCSIQDHSIFSSTSGQGNDGRYLAGAISELEKIRHNHEVAKLSMLILNMILEHGFALETKPGKKTNGGMLVNRHLHDDFE